MLEPQSTVLFVLLVLIFGGLIWWLVRTRHLVVRVVAACLSFVVAVQFGVLAVNKYFGYYTHVGRGHRRPLQPEHLLRTAGFLAAACWSGNRSLAFDQRTVYLRLALQQGYTLGITWRAS